ncbi:AraC family transcriptional regulator [Paraburkholderia aromaticivorans]|uniref:AraC family transcriptional regulator n=1 Tax=Paraburkholderia aromaticivorans TaxID=2026199 RepID=A0A248VKU1_9BURK|nr:AraC family transcriptional regulator [Paraburkholderia aromaticivorans]ASV99151.1 AraC family transcriptional regulator [Paraburkholderia aromaticivorans]
MSDEPASSPPRSRAPSPSVSLALSSGEKHGSDWIYRSPQTAGANGIERIEAFFHHAGYAMHRHDTYAIGRTLAGVQSFRYRGSMRSSLPGGTMVLHPDEPHDGQAGTGYGFHYRMIYVDPALFQQALGGKPLPFLEGGLSNDPRLFAATEGLLRAMESAIDPLEQDGALHELAVALDTVAGGRDTPRPVDYRAARLARDYLLASLDRAVTLDELAAASGRDRWSLSRDFRALFGTSPHRYLTMRRLDLVRQLVLKGVSLADAAAASGFADQSHMTRHFKHAWGVAPAQWLKMLGSSVHGGR